MKINTPDEIKSASTNFEFTEKLRSIGPLKLAAREMTK